MVGLRVKSLGFTVWSYLDPTVSILGLPLTTTWGALGAQMKGVAGFRIEGLVAWCSPHEL